MAGVVVLPEKVLKKLNKSILPQWKVCFFAALLTGLAAHLYKITNWLPNWDSLVFRYDSQNMIGLGRWFLPVVCSFSSFYDLPLLNGLLSIVFHALGAVFICGMLDVRKRITAAIIGAVTVSFPTVTSVMMYNYVADGYGISFFLAVLAAYFLTRPKPKYLISATLIALSLGIYQAYVTVTIMLVLLHLTDELVFGGAAFKKLFKKAMKILLSGVAGAVLYAVVMKAVLALSKTNLLEYQGLDSAASLSEIDIFASLYTVKETFVKCFFDVSNGVNVYVVLNVIIMLFTLAYYIKSIIKNKVYKKPHNLVMLAVIGVMLVWGASALAFVNAGVDYHNLMLMGYSVFYLFFILVYERGSEANENRGAVKCWCVLAISALLVANQIVIANVSYHKAQMAYEKSYGTLVRIADRIDLTDGTKECGRILVVGALSNSRDYSVNLTPDITGITDGYILRADDETVGQSVLCSALNDYCDKNYNFVYGEEKKSFLQRQDVKTMETWPDKGCIAVIEDVIVIKLGSECENK